MSEKVLITAHIPGREPISWTTDADGTHTPEPSSAIESVIAERQRQDAKWGEQNHEPSIFLAILAEEVGEVAQEVLGLRFGACAKGGEGAAYRKEMVEVAAVAITAIEAFDRGAR